MIDDKYPRAVLTKTEIRLIEDMCRGFEWESRRFTASYLGLVKVYGKEHSLATGFPCWFLDNMFGETLCVMYDKVGMPSVYSQQLESVAQFVADFSALGIGYIFSKIDE